MAAIACIGSALLLSHDPELGAWLWAVVAQHYVDACLLRSIRGCC